MSVRIKKEVLFGLLAGIAISILIIAFGGKLLNVYYHTPLGRVNSLNALSSIIRREHIYTDNDDKPLAVAYAQYYNTDDIPDNHSIKKIFKNEIRNNDEAYYTIANIMLSHYDRYSSLSKPEIYEEMYPDNENYVGLGAEISSYGPFIRINKVYNDSAADNAGVLPGDLICSIGNNDIRFLDYYDASSVLAQEIKNGTTLGIYRVNEDHIIYIDITAQEVIVPNISWSIDGDVAYLNITLFRGETFETDIDKAFSEFSESGVRYLILDMRDNRGGYIRYLEFLLNKLTPQKDLLLFTEHYRKEDTEFLSTGTDVSFDNIVVLVNEKTCSSAEVLSGSLKDQGYMLIGQTTYGKGIGLSNSTFRGDKLVLATMTLYLPETGDYNDKGIAPSIDMDNELVKIELPECSETSFTTEFSCSSDNDEILALEERLALLGYQFNNIDGSWDTYTETALMQFMTGAGEEYEGVCDIQTFRTLDRLCNEFYDAVYIEDTQLLYALDSVLKKAE